MSRHHNNTAVFTRNEYYEPVSYLLKVNIFNSFYSLHASGCELVKLSAWSQRSLICSHSHCTAEWTTRQNSWTVSFQPKVSMVENPQQQSPAKPEDCTGKYTENNYFV